MALIRSTRQVDFQFKVGDLSAGKLEVAGFSGHEGVSEPFRFLIELVSSDPGIPFDDVVGQPGALRIDGPSGTRWVQGYVARFEQADKNERLTTYVAELVPELMRLTHRARCRIFPPNMDAKDIVSKVLEDAGIKKDRFAFSLREKDYPKRDYTVQYRETDLRFIHRILEEEGIWYYFVHDDKGHVVRFVDNIGEANQVEGKSFPYRQAAGMRPDEETIGDFRYGQEVRTGSYLHRDFNYLKPTVFPEWKEDADREKDLFVYDYPGGYSRPEQKDKDENEAKRLGKVRLEEARATRLIASGDGNSRMFVPGRRFEMKEHPRPDDKIPKFNREYYLLRVSHHGSQPQVRGEEERASEGFRYENRFECVPSDATYRPPRVTPKPVIAGVQTATVVGPANEEIHTDEWGRIKVQFHWDLDGKNDEKSSCWIRVNQSWAGPSYGAIAIPRVGWEVLVAFEEGDPDRPVVTGGLYHGTHKPPYTLPDHKTQSGVKTSTSPGGGGSNEIRFEDADGEEEIFVHAQKNMTVSVEADRSVSIGNNSSESVKKNKTITVEGTHTETITGDTNVRVGDGMMHISVKKELFATADDGDVVLQSFNKLTHVVGKTESLLSGEQKAKVLSTGGPVEIDGSSQVEIKCGSTTITVTSSAVTINASSGTVDINGGGATVVCNSSGVTITGTVVKLNA